ncbi:MAG: TlpA disulfide reductase family protein [Acidobacteriota bacterium]
MTEDPSESPTAAQATPPARRSRGRRRLRHLGQWLLFVTLAFTAVTVVGRLRAPALDGPAPNFALRNLDGEIVQLSDFRGQTVVLNFWATWCPPCRVELPSFARFARKNPEIAVLGLSVQSPPNDLKATVEKREIPYPVLIVDGETAEAYGVSSLPTTIIITPEGQVRWAHSGVLFGPQLWWMTR